jgi:hypothetical protein
MIKIETKHQKLFNTKIHLFLTGHESNPVVGRVATKVGFHNFAKYEISRNTLLISRNFAKFREIDKYEFREISARNLISRNSAKSSHYRFSRNL